MAESLQYPLSCPYIVTYIVTSKRGSPEEVLVPMMFTASSMRRLSRRKRSQLQWRTPTPPSLQREHCVEDPSCKHGSFFPTSSLTSSCSPNLCRRSKWGSLGKGGRTWMATGQQTFRSSRLTWEITLPFQGRKVSPFSTAVLHDKWSASQQLRFKYKFVEKHYIIYLTV